VAPDSMVPARLVGQMSRRGGSDYGGSALVGACLVQVWGPGTYSADLADQMVEESTMFPTDSEASQ